MKTATMTATSSVQHSNSYYVPVGDYTPSERKPHYLDNALTTGQITCGALSEDLEERIAQAHGKRFGIFMNSRSSALYIALAALKQHDGWEDGDAIIFPGTIFVATANVVLHNGLRPIFVDVHINSFNIRPDLIEGRITACTKWIPDSIDEYFGTTK
ncbi:DegT/DnrJ/EryC1/StrS family aminotransferase [Ferrimicrobium sp.]|uniref:DegT/DnrJ/EryC1/StrS family aminotransferase n=1 Tax=Ferrimicrobium sp. TaxID=2926050 RepID=UPI00261FE9F1|nr:DegT/DnrJ/EryC1/StrS family aminotransferase [Ferrimicrobium sp.]